MTSDSQRLIALYRITSDSALGLDAKVARLLAFGCETFGLSVGILARIDIGAGRHECVAVSPASMGLSRGEVRPLGDTYCSRTVESPEPVSFTRASGSVWERHPCWAATRLEAYFGARVMVDGAVWGTLSFASLKPVEQEFSRADQHFLQLMAQWVGAEFERGQREEALAVMTDWQRAILDGASYSIIATDPEGIILSFNAAAEHMLGYRADELVGKFSPAVLHDPEEVVARAASLSEEMGENIAPGFAVFVAKTLRGVAEEREWTYIRRDGSRVPVLLSVTTLRKGDGSIRGYLGIARDISRQRELEGALRQSEESYRSVVSSMAEGVIVRSVDGRVITANPAAQRILGLGEADLLSRSVAGEARLLAVHEDGRPFAPEEHPTARTLASGESVRGVVMGLLLPDGGLTWTSVNCEPVLPPGGGSPLAVVTSFADINAIKRAEDDLRHSEERLAFVLKGADVGAWDWRIPADEVIYNHRCVGKLGYSREEFPPGIAGWKSRIHPDDLSLMESAMADHLAGRCGQYEAEYRLATRDGRWMWVLDRGQVTEWDEAGQPIRFSGIQMDVTARRELAAESARAEANDLSRAMMRTIAEGVVGIGTSYPYPVRLLNPHAETLLGVSEAEALGQPVEKFISLVDEDGQPKGSIGRYTQSCDYGPFEAQVATPASPTGFPAILKFSCIHDYGGGALTMLTLQDITQRRLAERKLMLSDRVFEYSAEAILVTDASGVILSVNPAFTYITGYRPDEAVGNTPRLLKSGRHDQAFYTAFWHTLTTEGRWQGEIWDRRKDGTIYPKWTTINAVREGGRITHFVALFSDISERKEHENRIRYLAEHDHLTGLPNRRLLEERGRQLIGSGRRRDTGMAVMMIDLDRFKFVNDTLGHQIGDRLLVEVARRLVGCVRATDTVVRLGGDEFVLLLEEMEGAEDAVVVARKVHEALNLPIHIEGKALHTPPSIGISLYPNDGEDIDTLMRHADAAMYQAKEAGRNTWRFFTAEMNAAMQDRLRLEQDMRHSLENEGFELHFQPQFDVHERQIVVWEALLRWPHPERGWVGPDQVIPIAEETGLILPLGCWVLRAACREMRRWQDEGLGVFRVGINLSPHQVSQPDLVECVTDALAMYDLTPERLELEITESVLLARSPHILETLRRLKALGVSLTLDDFGTGYSSLTYLKAFAVDRVKIDRSFVRDLVHDSNDAAIVRAVISLARALNLGVVAEGVETADQQAFLLEHGCRETQGYLMGRPMAGREVAAYLDRIRDAH